MQSYVDRFYLQGMKKFKVNYLGFRKILYDELSACSNSKDEGIRSNAIAFHGLLEKYYYISPSLLKKLIKINMRMTIDYIYKKVFGIEYAYLISGVETRPETFPIALDKRFAIVTINYRGIVIHFTSNYDEPFKILSTAILFKDRHNTVTNSIEIFKTSDFDNKEFLLVMPEDEIALITKKIMYSFAYIACSGNPDLREVNEFKQIQTAKQAKKLKNNNNDILASRIDVGLSYGKERLYTKDKWEREAHPRWQPYGPKGNPTHYDLIQIPWTTVRRKAGKDNGQKIAHS